MYCIYFYLKYLYHVLINNIDRIMYSVYIHHVMRNVLNIFIGIVFAVISFILLLLISYVLFLYICKFNFLSNNDWVGIFSILKDKWHINTIYTMAFISLIIGLILILFSSISLFTIYVYKSVYNWLKPKKHKLLPVDFSKKEFHKVNGRYKTNSLTKNNFNKSSVKSETKVPDDQVNIDKGNKKVNSDNTEIPLPKSIINSDAYAVVQKLQHNNINPLISEQSESDSTKKDDGKKIEDANTKKDELRKRILKKFNTSLNDMKNKNDVP